MPEIGLKEALLLTPFVALLLWALVDVIRRPESQMRKLPKWGWIIVVLLGSTLGQLVYLAYARIPAAEVAGPEHTARPEGADASGAIDRLYGPKGDPS